MGLRIFIINEDDSLKRLSIDRFERLRRDDPNARLHQYAYQKIRYALVFLETKDRRAVGINYINYGYLVFDSNGGLDTDYREQAARMALEILPPMESDEGPNSVIDAGHKFAKKRYDNQFKWRPTQEMEVAIIKAVLGKNFS